MMMPSITICTFLSITNGFKLFDQNLSLTAGEPSKLSELLALNIYNTVLRAVPAGRAWARRRPSSSASWSWPSASSSCA